MICLLTFAQEQCQSSKRHISAAVGLRVAAVLGALGWATTAGTPVVHVMTSRVSRGNEFLTLSLEALESCAILDFLLSSVDIWKLSRTFLPLTKRLTRSWSRVRSTAGKRPHRLDALKCIVLDLF